MSRKQSLSIMLLIYTVLLTSVPLSAQEEEGEIIIISERVGKEIDPEENNKFKLFEGIKGFQSAVYIKLPDGRYFLKITYLDDKSGETKISRTLQLEASIKNRGNYIDRFEEIQAANHQYQDLSKPQTVSSDSGKIQEQKKYLYSNPGVSIYFELLGKGFYSINIDNRINRSKALSFGLSVLGVWAIQPSIMFYKFSGAKYRFELGIGLSSIIVESHGIVWTFVNGVVGYRYQQKNGLLFRIGFTPILGYVFSDSEVKFLPSVGISLGYSF